jgi:3-phenylpropionate/cinnamic acid dioxygenase small subunit
MPVPEDAQLTLVASHLLARYAWAIDDRSYDDLREIFADDVVADYGAFTCRSAEELVSRMEEIHRDLVTTQHLVGSVHARRGGAGEIDVRSHVRATLVRTRGERGRVEVAATYRDRLIDTPTGLRITERSVEGRWIDGERSILPWFHGGSSGASSMDRGSTGAADTPSGARRVDRSQTTLTAQRSSNPKDRGI